MGTMKFKIIKITQKQYELIKFIEEGMPFGSCLLTTHDGQPQRVENINKKRIFGTVDNFGKTPENEIKNEEKPFGT